MDYIKTLPLPPPRCRSAPHQLPPASAVCNYFENHSKRSYRNALNHGWKRRICSARAAEYARFGETFGSPTQRLLSRHSLLGQL